MKAERDALQAKVFPKLRDLCREKGSRFQAVDLRWGVSQEAGLDQQTIKICLEEIGRCQKVTPRPNFIVLLGNKYGWKPLPAEIDESKYQIIEKYLNEADKQILLQWYKKDENSIPQVYCLQPRTRDFEKREIWAEVESKISYILSKTSWTDDAISPRSRYGLSATELEINAGAFMTTTDHAYCYLRTIKGVTPTLAACEYFDLKDDGKIDKEALHSLDDLKSRLRSHFPKENIYDYEAKWNGSGLDTDYLDSFCQKVEEDLKKAILEELQKEEIKEDLALEIESHRSFCSERREHFLGREDLVSLFKKYLIDSGGHPLAFFGVQGIGKSALMAHLVGIVQQKQSSLVSVFRFVGATPASTTLRSLLGSLCQEIAELYNRDIGALPSEAQDLKDLFLNQLKNIPNKKPLIIFIDALDQISPEDGGKTIDWLPASLPENVHVIVSVLDEHEDESLNNVREKLDTAYLIQINPLTKNNCSILLNNWLHNVNRRLQPEQLEDLLQKFKRKPIPLYMKVCFEEARLWKSYDGLPIGSKNIAGLSDDIDGVIEDMLWRLEQPRHFGYALVSKSLGYLAAARYGLSEDELIDMLSADSEVMAEFRKLSPRAPQSRALPPMIWARLHSEIEPYLFERTSDGATLISFYHRRISKVVKKRYFSDGKESAAHAQLAKYFSGEFDSASQPTVFPADTGSPTINYRKLSELPYQLEQAGDKTKLLKVLTDLTIFITGFGNGYQYEWVHYWAALKKEYSPSEYYLKALQAEECDQGISNTLVEQYLSLGSFLNEYLGQASASLEFYKRAVELSEEYFGKHHRNTLTPINNLSVLLSNLGQHEHALRLQKKGMKIQQALYGTDDPTLLNNLAAKYIKNANHVQAVPLLNKAYALSNKSKDIDYGIQTIILSNLYKSYLSLKDYEKARLFAEKALSVSKKYYGNDSTEMAAALNNLGEFNCSKHSSEDPVPLLKQSLKIYEGKYGKNNINIIKTINTLAVSYNNKGYIFKSIPLFFRSFRINKENLGRKHEDTASALIILASSLIVPMIGLLLILSAFTNMLLLSDHSSPIHSLLLLVSMLSSESIFTSNGLVIPTIILSALTIILGLSFGFYLLSDKYMKPILVVTAIYFLLMGALNAADFAIGIHKSEIWYFPLIIGFMQTALCVPLLLARLGMGLLSSSPETKQSLKKWGDDVDQKTNEFSESKDEDLLVKNFITTRGKNYYCKKIYLETLRDHLTGNAAPLVIAGKPGSGKSALISHLLTEHYEDLRLMQVQKWLRVKIVSRFVGVLLTRFGIMKKYTLAVHFVEASPFGSESSSMLGTMLLRMQRFFYLERDIPNDPKELPEAFATYLNTIQTFGKKRRATIIVDAVDELDSYGTDEWLRWLPSQLPKNIHVILSVSESNAIDEMKERGFDFLWLEPLEENEREQLIKNLISRKVMSDEEIEKIVKNELSASPLCLSMLVERLQATELDKTKRVSNLEHYLRANSEEDYFKSLLDAIIKTAAIGASENIKKALGALVVARRGLTRGELTELFTGSDLIDVDQFLLSAKHLLINQSQYFVYCHLNIKKAVAKMMSEEDELRCRRKLCNMFLNHGDLERKADEIPWQFAKANDWENLYSYLSDFQALELLFETNQEEVVNYWKTIETKSELRILDAFRKVIDRTEPSEKFHVWVLPLLLDKLDYKSHAKSLRYYLNNDYEDAGDIENTEAAQARAKILLEWGYPDIAIAYLEKEQLSYRQSNKQAALIEALCDHGLILLDHGLNNDAMRLYAEAETLARSSQDNWQLQVCLGYEGLLLSKKGEFEDALRFHEEEAEICRELKADDALSWSLMEQADIHFHLNNSESCEKLCNQVIKISKELNNTNRLIYSLGLEALLFKKMGRFEEAISAFQEREDVCRAENEDSSVHWCLWNRLRLLYKMKNYDEYMMLFPEFIRLSRKLNEMTDLMSAFGMQGVILRSKKNYDEALRSHFEEEKIALENSNDGGLQISFGRQALIYKEKGEFENALALLAKKEEICRRIDNHPSLIWTLGQMAVIYEKTGNNAQALKVLRQRIELCRVAKKQDVLGKSLLRVAKILHDSNAQDDEALELASEALSIAQENQLEEIEEEARRYIERFTAR